MMGDRRKGGWKKKKKGKKKTRYSNLSHEVVETGCILKDISCEPNSCICGIVISKCGHQRGRGGGGGGKRKQLKALLKFHSFTTHIYQFHHNCLKANRVKKKERRGKKKRGNRLGIHALLWNDIFECWISILTWFAYPDVLQPGTRKEEKENKRGKRQLFSSSSSLSNFILFLNTLMAEIGVLGGQDREKGGGGGGGGGGCKKCQKGAIFSFSKPLLTLILFSIAMPCQALHIPHDSAGREGKREGGGGGGKGAHFLCFWADTSAHLFSRISFRGCGGLKFWCMGGKGKEGKGKRGKKKASLSDFFFSSCLNSPHPPMLFMGFGWMTPQGLGWRKRRKGEKEKRNLSHQNVFPCIGTMSSYLAQHADAAMLHKFLTQQTDTLQKKKKKKKKRKEGESSLSFFILAGKHGPVQWHLLLVPPAPITVFPTIEDWGMRTGWKRKERKHSPVCPSQNTNYHSNGDWHNENTESGVDKAWQKMENGSVLAEGEKKGKKRKEGEGEKCLTWKCKTSWYHDSTTHKHLPNIIDSLSFWNHKDKGISLGNAKKGYGGRKGEGGGGGKKEKQ